MSQDEQPSRFLTWDACYNVRDLGGFPIGGGKRTQPRVLVRADNLHRLTPNGQGALLDYGVRTVIDLRLAHELESHPNPFSSQEKHKAMPRYLNLPLHDQEAAEAMSAEESLAGEYIVLLERSKGLIAAVFEAAAAGMEEGAVVVHCHGGKDRTGIVVALMLSVAGVRRETIVADYALSEARLEPIHSAWLEEQSRAQGKPIERPRWMNSRPETMHAVLGFLDREYGGADGYLAAAGVSRSCITEIRKRLIKPAGKKSS